MEQWWKDTKMGNLNILRKTCPRAALSIVNPVNPTWSGLEVNPGHLLSQPLQDFFSAAWYSKHKDSTLHGKQFYKVIFIKDIAYIQKECTNKMSQ